MAHRDLPPHLSETQGPPWKTQKPYSQGEDRAEGQEGDS